METNTKKEVEAPAQTNTGNAQLAVSQPGAITTPGKPTVWDEARIALLKRMKMPQGASDDEFAIFLEQCLRTGMDPLIDEADCVPRNKKVKVWKSGAAGRYSVDETQTFHVFQPREAGMRARADRFPDYRGITSAVVRVGDVCELDPVNGTVRHIIAVSAEREKKDIIGAWALIRREGRVVAPVYLSLGEMVVTQNPLWAANQKQARMAEKAVRAEALRREYPNAFGGLYTKEEFEDRELREINPAPANAAPDASKSRTESVSDKVKAKAAEGRKQEPEDAQVVDHAPPAEAKKEDPPKPNPSPPKEPKKPRQPGTFRGYAISDLDGQSLEDAIEMMEKGVNAKPVPKNIDGARTVLAELIAEKKKRLDAAGAATEEAPMREPGSDDDMPI